MTLLTEAKKRVTEDIEDVAKSEGVTSERLRRNVTSGRSVIVKSPSDASPALGIGEILRTKINANIGTSLECIEKNEEL